MARADFWQRVIDAGHDLDDIPDFQAMSLLTGIGVSSLTDMASGYTKPSPEHLKAIEEIVGPKIAKEYNTHKRNRPKASDGLSAPIGSVPFGYEFIPNALIKSLQVGDLLPYDRGLEFKRGRIIWLPVVYTEPFEREWGYFIELPRGVTLKAQAESVIRCARPLNPVVVIDQEDEDTQ